MSEDQRPSTIAYIALLYQLRLVVKLDQLHHALVECLEELPRITTSVAPPCKQRSSSSSRMPRQQTTRLLQICRTSATKHAEKSGQWTSRGLGKAIRAQIEDRVPDLWLQDTEHGLFHNPPKAGVWPNSGMKDYLIKGTMRLSQKGLPTDVPVSHSSRTQFYEMLIATQSLWIFLVEPPQLPLVMQRCSTLFDKCGHALAVGISSLAANISRHMPLKCPSGLRELPFETRAESSNPQNSVYPMWQICVPLLVEIIKDEAAKAAFVSEDDAVAVPIVRSLARFIRERHILDSAYSQQLSEYLINEVSVPLAIMLRRDVEGMLVAGAACIFSAMLSDKQGLKGRQRLGAYICKLGVTEEISRFYELQCRETCLGCLDQADREDCVNMFIDMMTFLKLMAVSPGVLVPACGSLHIYFWTFFLICDQVRILDVPNRDYSSSCQYAKDSIPLCTKLVAEGWDMLATFSSVMKEAEEQKIFPNRTINSRKLQFNRLRTLIQLNCTPDKAEAMRFTLEAALEFSDLRITWHWKSLMEIFAAICSLPEPGDIMLSKQTYETMSQCLVQMAKEEAKAVLYYMYPFTTEEAFLLIRGDSSWPQLPESMPLHHQLVYVTSVMRVLTDTNLSMMLMDQESRFELLLDMWIDLLLHLARKVEEWAEGPLAWCVGPFLQHAEQFAVACTKETSPILEALMRSHVTFASSLSQDPNQRFQRLLETAPGEHLMDHLLQKMSEAKATGQLEEPYFSFAIMLRETAEICVSNPTEISLASFSSECMMVFMRALRVYHATYEHDLLLPIEEQQMKFLECAFQKCWTLRVICILISDGEPEPMKQWGAEITRFLLFGMKVASASTEVLLNCHAHMLRFSCALADTEELFVKLELPPAFLNLIAQTDLIPQIKADLRKWEGHIAVTRELVKRLGVTEASKPRFCEDVWRQNARGSELRKGKNVFSQPALTENGAREQTGKREAAKAHKAARKKQSNLNGQSQQSYACLPPLKHSETDKGNERHSEVKDQKLDQSSPVQSDYLANPWRSLGQNLKGSQTDLDSGAEKQSKRKEGKKLKDKENDQAERAPVPTSLKALKALAKRAKPKKGDLSQSQKTADIAQLATPASLDKLETAELDTSRAQDGAERCSEQDCNEPRNDTQSQAQGEGKPEQVDKPVAKLLRPQPPQIQPSTRAPLYRPSPEDLEPAQCTSQAGVVPDTKAVNRQLSDQSASGKDHRVPINDSTDTMPSSRARPGERGQALPPIKLVGQKSRKAFNADAKSLTELVSSSRQSRQRIARPVPPSRMNSSLGDGCESVKAAL